MPAAAPFADAVMTPLAVAAVKVYFQMTLAAAMQAGAEGYGAGEVDVGDGDGAGEVDVGDGDGAGEVEVGDGDGAGEVDVGDGDGDEVVDGLGLGDGDP